MILDRNVRMSFTAYLRDFVSSRGIHALGMEIVTLKKTWHGYMNNIQWNLSNLTHQGNREMCRIVQDVGILRFYFS
jgi:hypothetical protein